MADTHRPLVCLPTWLGGHSAYAPLRACAPPGESGELGEAR